MKKNVLLIDDYESDRLLYKEYLGTERYNFTEAADGVEAANILKSFVPDVILLDWQMPKMNGLETLKFIGEDYDIQGIPVIMITGMSRDTVIEGAFENGIFDFIEKPVDPMNLELRVNRSLEMSDAYMKLKTEIRKVNELNKSVEMLKADIINLNQKREKGIRSEQDQLQITKEQLILFESDGRVVQSNVRDALHHLDAVINSPRCQ